MNISNCTSTNKLNNSRDLSKVHADYVNSSNLIIENEFPAITDYKQLYFNLSRDEIRVICNIIRDEQTIPFFEFVRDILLQRYDVDHFLISWFLPRVTLFERINCSLFLSSDAIYANLISMNKMIPLMYYSEINLMSLIVEKVNISNNNEFRFRLFLQSINNTYLIIDLFEYSKEFSQLSILLEILKLYKVITEYNRDKEELTLNFPNAPFTAFFNSRNDFFNWFK